MKTIGIPLAAMALAPCASGAAAQTARDYRRAPGVVPLTSEGPPTKIVIDPPVAEWLAHVKRQKRFDPLNRALRRNNLY